MRPGFPILLSALLFTAWRADAVTSTTTGVVIQSHRGAGELAPENTLEAFELAWKLGTWPEADVQATTDGVIVAFHDKNFKRVVKEMPPGLEGKGVSDLTWSELSKLDVGAWKGEEFAGLRIPRLSAVFERMADHPDRHLYLDIKKAALPDLAREVRAHGVAGQVVLASPSHDIIREWKRLVPESDTLLWMSGKEPEIAKKLQAARAADFEGLTQMQIHVHLKEPAQDVRRDSADPFTPSDEFIRRTGEELRTRGILLQAFPYGGTTREIYWKLLDLGVASFATDHPDITVEAVRARPATK